MATQVEQLESNIVATVATAEAVLAHFERSLLDAGFAEGAQSYVRLADTLLGQRLWAESSGMARAARFEAVGAHARAIHALLAPYVEAFQRLSALGVSALVDEARPEDAPVAEDDPLALGILDQLDPTGKPMSVTALRAALGVRKPVLVAALDRLTEAGLVERSQSSRRELVRRARP